MQTKSHDGFAWFFYIIQCTQDVVFPHGVRHCEPHLLDGLQGDLILESLNIC